jgi:hypothetical protein
VRGESRGHVRIDSPVGGEYILLSSTSFHCEMIKPLEKGV